MEDNITEILLNMHNFNQDLMKLNIKYSEDIERLHSIIKEVREIINQPMINYSSCIKALDEIEIVLDKEDNKTKY